MKKSFIYLAVLALGLTACENDVENYAPVAGNGEAALLSVNLKAAGTFGATRAATVGNFEYGSPEENKVAKVDFYFFEADGDAYSVVSTGENVITWTAKEAEEGKNAENVEKVSDVVLVIKKHQTALPAKVVAVINSGVDYSNKSLSTMANTLVEELSNENGFVMSNSVYADGDVVINATDILPENIFAAEDADLTATPGQVIANDKVASLKINPVDIYVERVAAKVRVAASTVKIGEEELELMPIYDSEGTQQMVDAAGNAVYAKILGWDVTNTVTAANTLKAIDPAWTNLGFTPWNNAAFFRSYWAATPADCVPAHTHTFASLTNSNAKYYFENTKATADANSVTEGEGNQTPQLLVAAKLVDEDGVAIQLAKWYNVLYTIEDLQVAMVNQIASKMYVKRYVTEGDVTETHYSSVTVSDVEFEQRAEDTADNRYEVIMVAKDGVEYYSPANAKENGTAMTATEAKAIIAGVDPAMMWTEGSTYYYLDIPHFGTATGMVRNHVYDITLTKVLGFGTPVYNDGHIITPERPDDQPAANIAAQINILSWHVVSNEVELQ